METDISRRGFLALGALGLGSVALGQNVAFADDVSLNKSELKGDELIPEGGVALNYVDPNCPEARVLVIDPNDELPQTIDPKRVEVKKTESRFDSDTGEGETEYEISFTGLCSEQELNQGKGVFSTQSANSIDKSDVVVRIKATATWTLSGDDKKINLKKVSGSFIPKMGSISNRCILIRNETKQKKVTGIKKNNFSYSLNWGFIEFHDGYKESLHFVNIWCTAKASGMGGKKEIVCTFSYGSK